MNQICTALLPGLLKALGKDIGVELGVGGNLGGGQQRLVKGLGCKIHAVLILPVPHGNGEGQHLDAQLPGQGGGNVRGGVRGKFNPSHSISFCRASQPPFYL